MYVETIIIVRMCIVVTMTEIDVFPEHSAEDLLTVLAEHTAVYNLENQKIPVKLTEDTPHIAADGSKVAVNPVKAYQVKHEMDLPERDALRLLLDTLSHEVAHYNYSDLESKNDFMEEFPTAPKLAGAVINILEDFYIDYRRLTRFDGLKKPFNVKTEYVLRDLDLEDGPKEFQAIKTLQYVFRTGKMPKTSNPFIRGLAEFYLEKIRETIKADKPEERQSIAETIVATILDQIGAAEVEDDIIETIEDLIDEINEELADEVKIDLDKVRDELIEDLENDIEEKAEDVEIPEEENLEPENIEESEDPEEDPENAGTLEGTGESTEDGSKEDSEISGPAQDPEESEQESEEPAKGSSGSSEGLESGSEESQESGDSKGEKDGVKTFNADKFKDPDVDGSVTSEVEYTPRKMDRKGLSRSKTSANDLSEDVKEALEDLDDDMHQKKRINADNGDKLDIRRSIRYMAGDKSSRKIYSKERRREPDNRTIGITIDASGSMRGKEMEQALKAAGAIGKAAETLGDNVTINTHYSYRKSEDDRSSGESTTTELLSPVNEEFEMDQLDSVETHHREPIALGLNDIEEEMLKSENAGEDVIFVIHDGNPTITTEGVPYRPDGTNMDAVAEISHEVQRLRNKDFTVIGIAVGNSPDEAVLDDLFGSQGWRRFDADELPAQILEMYKSV